MGSFRSASRPLRHQADARTERGATLSEYALLVALVVVVSIGAISLLEDESGSFLVDTGSDIGVPRELAADIDPDLPEAPAWLTQPPPPTTTTTAPTTTTTASTTSTTTAVIIFQGAMSSVGHATDCLQATDPGIAGSTIDIVACDGGADQDVAATGTASAVTMSFTDGANTGFCFAESTNQVILASCDGGDWQLFDVTDNGDGSYTFVSRSNGLCIREGGASGLSLQTCNANTEQAFTF